MNFIFHLSSINGENNQLLPSILKTHRVGDVFIHSCGFFYAGFVRFV
jgi:hypothetical protein